jgi:glycine cleavage system H protein
MKIIDGLLYTNEHEWVKVDGKEAYLGITDYAQKALGSIVFVELPEADVEFSAGDTFGTIESVKAASDVYIPVSGKIIEVNDAIVDSPELLNQKPYENWMIHFEITDDSELNKLMQAKEYEEFCSKEA